MSGNSIEIERLACIPRGETDEFRISLDEFTSEDGKTSQYVSLRQWYRGADGTMCPTKKGITVRASELKTVGLALKEAFVRLGQPEARPPAATSRAQPAQHRTVRAAPVQRSFADDDGDLTAGGAL